MSDRQASLSVTSIPRKCERIAARTIEGKAVIVVLDAQRLHTLNGVGTRVFELCDGTRNVAAIARQIASEFKVDESQAQADAQTFLSQLVAEGAIELDAGSALR